jgi:hypothetical protein
MNAIKGNLLILNKRNELVFSNDRSWAVLGAYATQDLESALLAHGDRSIRVQFTTSPIHVEEDTAKYAKRLKKLLPLFVCGDFRPVVINGRVLPNTLTTLLERIG